jgi:hypothetical protein
MIKKASTPPTSVQVQIPEDLAGYLMQQTEVCGRFIMVRAKGNSTHSLSKYYGFYLLLKAESPEAGWIKNYVKQIPLLAKNFGISKRTFFTYLKQLEQLNLAFRQGDDIRITGWDQLAGMLNINTKKRTKITFNYDGKQKIHWWFAAVEIASNQECQAFMIWKKVNKNSETKNLLLTAMKARGFDLSKQDDPEYFSGQLFRLYLEDFKSGTEVHNILINIRSDVNRGVKKIAEAWKMSPQLTSYWKKKMSVQSIISVSKMKVVSEWTRATNECHKNNFCHVIWNDHLKQRVWFLCDQINLITPWKWQEFLAKNEAKNSLISL